MFASQMARFGNQTFSSITGKHILQVENDLPMQTWSHKAYLSISQKSWLYYR